MAALRLTMAPMAWRLMAFHATQHFMCHEGLALHAVCLYWASAIYCGRCQQPSPQSLETETVSGALLSVVLAARDNAFVCIALVAIIVFLATSTRRSAHRCPRCKEINREAAIYCAQCGTRLRKK